MMRILLLCLALVACSDTESPVDTRDPGPPETPFDSIDWACQADTVVVNGQVQVVCPGGAQ